MILPLEDMVCSLSSAKRLKELGVRQDSLFYWNDKHFNELSDGSLCEIPVTIVDSYNYKGTSPKDKYFSAYTASELGELLPKTINESYLFIGFSDTTWWITYQKSDRLTQESMNEAECRAKMLIYLLENGIYKVKEENVSKH